MPAPGASDMDVDVNMDIDIDLGPIDQDLPYMDSDQNHLSHTSDARNDVDLEIDAEQAPYKVHVRGVDDLTTNDIKAFSTEHYPSNPPVRIEWVDDTSANIIYEDSAIASEALQSLSSIGNEVDYASTPVIQLREAKHSSTHPTSNLQVRIALLTDRKRPRAHEASRFYMLHPEHDPREQRRQGERKRLNGHDGYERRRYSDQEQRRRRNRDREEGFDPSMYDDNANSSGRGSVDRLSNEEDKDRSYHSRRRRDSYRPVRDRSASPVRGSRSRHDERIRTPPPSYRTRDPYPFPKGNTDKELFPSKSAPDDHSEGKKDLFSNKILAAGLKKELFPQKTNTVNHRRSDAFDAADETADLFANGLSVPFTEGSRKSTRLIDKVHIGQPNTSYGRLKDTGALQPNNDDGLNIRGASDQQGFSIRGGASAAGTIKELFPGRQIGNGGKELFSEKLHGRGGRRNRAEDMFH